MRILMHPVLYSNHEKADAIFIRNFQQRSIISRLPNDFFSFAFLKVTPADAIYEI